MNGVCLILIVLELSVLIALELTRVTRPTTILTPAPPDAPTVADGAWDADSRIVYPTAPAGPRIGHVHRRRPQQGTDEPTGIHVREGTFAWIDAMADYDKVIYVNGAPVEKP